MINPMTRYGFLIYHEDLPDFLEKLRELGLVDVTTRDWVASDSERELLNRSEKYKSVAKAMKSIKTDPADTPFDSVDLAVAGFEKTGEAIAAAETAIRKAAADMDELEMWGEFDPEMIDKLRREGISLHFFEAPTKQYDNEWEELYPVEIVHQDKTNTYFVIARQAGDDTPVDLSGIVERHAPQVSAAKKEAEIEELIREQTRWQKDKARAALSRKDIEEAYRNTREELDFSRALNSGESYADGKIKILEGFSVAQDRQKIIDFAEQENVIYEVEDAKAEQDPPIKLKNNFFARLYEPIGSLYMPPRYNELDLTPFFAPFFMLFFGMCFADAGYGLLFLLLLGIFWHKIPQKFKPFGWLAFFLSISATIFGFLTGNVYGIQLVDIPAFATMKQYFLDPDNLFYLSIAVGALQMLFGQILRVFNKIKRGGSFVYGLSTIGWVLLMVSSVIAFSGLVSHYTSSSIAYHITLIAAGVLIFFFNSPRKNPFLNFGLGLYDAYGMATGVVGDLISYVRLFAIGLVGGVIGQVFNELAWGLGASMPFVVKQIVILAILLLGHGINIFVGVLGSFVHPVRLTFVEFYKNAEFEGGGREFNPLRKIERPETEAIK